MSSNKSDPPSHSSRVLAPTGRAPGNTSPLSGSSSLVPTYDTVPAASVGHEIVHEPFPAKSEQTNYRNRRFTDTNGKDAEFTGCDFSYCHFERAYLRNANFTKCTFTGARFADSNFRGATFVQCDLRYATFSNSLLEFSEILSNLPLEPNLRSDLLRSLRANAASIGDYDVQGPLVLAELAAGRDHYHRVFVGADSYYKR